MTDTMKDYKDRTQEEIFKNIKQEYEKDERDGISENKKLYNAAITTIDRYFKNEYFSTFQENNPRVDKYTDFSRQFVSEEYEILRNEFEELLKQGESIKEDENIDTHILGLASKINATEYETLLALRVYDAKYELYDGDLIKIPETGAFMSEINIPPSLTEKANNMTIAEVLRTTKADKDLTYTIDYSECTNPEYRERYEGEIYVNGEGVMFRKQNDFDLMLGSTPKPFEQQELPAWEGVKISSSKYISALKDYQDNKDEKKNEIKDLKEEEDKRYKEIIDMFGDPETFANFDDMVKLLFQEEIEYKGQKIKNPYYEVMVAYFPDKGKELTEYHRAQRYIAENGSNPYVDSQPDSDTIGNLHQNYMQQVNIRSTQYSATLLTSFAVAFDNKDKNFLFRFLVVSEARLDQIVQKNMKNGLHLSPTEPIKIKEQGIADANFFGDVDLEDNEIGENIFNSYSFDQKEQGDGLALFFFLVEQKNSLLSGLTDRITNKCESGDYNKLKEHIISEGETKYIDQTKPLDIENARKEYEIKCYALNQLIYMCKERAERCIDDKGKHHKLFNMGEYLKNILSDLEYYYKNGKLPTNETWQKIQNDFCKKWIDFKGNDGNFALFMSDDDVKHLIGGIFNTKFNNDIDFNIKELCNGMTLFDNTTGLNAIQNMVVNNSSNFYLADKDDNEKSPDQKWNTYRKKLNKDFDISVGDNGEIKGKEVFDNLYSYLENHSPNTDAQVRNRLEDHGYIPKEEARNNMDAKYLNEYNKCCKVICEGIQKKIELLKQLDKRQVSKEQIKDKLEKQKQELKGKSNLSLEQNNYLNGIDMILEDDNLLEEMVKEQNEDMKNSIKYGDIRELIIGNIAPTLIQAGGGLRSKNKSLNDRLIGKSINDSFGTRGWWDFSDSTNEIFSSNAIAMLAEEVIICAISGAIAGLTEGAGTPLLMRALTRLGRAVKRIFKSLTLLRRAEKVGRMCLKTKWGIKTARITKFLREGKFFRRSLGLILNGASFHLSSVVINNFVNGKPLDQGLENTEEFIRSIAFIGVLKMWGGPIGNLTKKGISNLLKKPVQNFTRRNRLTVSLASILGETVSLGLTDQTLNVIFEGNLKEITVEDVIHSLAMVIGLRIANCPINKAKKVIIREINRARSKVITKIVTEDGRTLEIGLMKVDGKYKWELINVEKSENNKPREKEEENEERKKNGEEKDKVENKNDQQNQNPSNRRKKQRSPDYFNGQPHEFDVSPEQAKENSHKMDEILDDISEGNLSQKLQELRKIIKEQYKQATGEELDLTNEQLLSILDAHEQDGILGELNGPQLRRKVEILAEAIKNNRVRRFLMEAGFCGKDSAKLDKVNSNEDVSKLNTQNVNENNTIESEQNYLKPEELADKLESIGIYLTSIDIEKVRNLTEEQINNIKYIKEELKIDLYTAEDIEKVRNLTEEQINNIKYIKDLGIFIRIVDIEKIKNLHLNNEEIKNIKKLVDAGVILFGEEIIHAKNLELNDIKIRNIKNLAKLGFRRETYNYRDFVDITDADVEYIKILENRLGIRLRNIFDLYTLYDKLSEEQISHLEEIKKSRNITLDLDNLHFFARFKPISSNDIKNYLRRKKNYLDKNRTLTDEQFNLLFKVNGSKAKYGMSEIKQKKLGLCYAYTGFESLKKKNFFEVLIKTSMKETDTGWEVKIPLGDPNGHIIRVNRSEIDKEFDFSKIDPERGPVKINSETSLGFKILEIAFIKTEIYNNKRFIKERNEFKTTGDITITPELLSQVEGGLTLDFLRNMLNKKVINCISFSRKDLQNYLRVQHNIGNLIIECGVSPGPKSKAIYQTKDFITKDGKRSYVYKKHSYGVENIYYDKNLGQDIIVFINPHDTSIKYEVTFDEFFKLFDKTFIMYIDINNMFQ